MHAIHFVDDCELPEGHDFMLVEIPDGGLIFYRESAITPTSLEDSWAAYRAVGEGGTPGPRQRPRVGLLSTG